MRSRQASIRRLILFPLFTLLASCGAEEVAAPAKAPSTVPGATGASLPGARRVGVDAVAKDPKAHAGLVAIEGVVGQVFKSRGSFTMIDVAEFEQCGTVDCAEYSVPVQVPKEEFEGELPKSEETVVAIGDVQPLEKGYRFVVQEVQRKDKRILRRTKDPSQPAK